MNSNFEGYSFIKSILREITSEQMVTLETGCGVGYYRNAVNGFYIGSDITGEEYLHSMQHIKGFEYRNPQLLQSRGKRNVDIVCDAAQLPIKDQALDLIFSVALIDFVGNHDAMFSESYRCLKKGGHLLVFTYRKSVLKKLHENYDPHHQVFSSVYLWRCFQRHGFKPHFLPLPLPQSKLKSFLIKYIPVLNIYRHFKSEWRIVMGEKL